MNSDSISALALALQARIPAIAWGPPGVAKTDIITGIGKALNRQVIEVSALLHEPSDFGGLPVASPDGSVTRMAPPYWVADAQATDDPIIFFDEVNLAPPAVQAPVMRIVLTGKVGAVRLPEGTSFVAAANPPDTSAGGWDLVPPLANRLLHLDWPVVGDSVTNWVRGMILGFPAPEFPTLPDNWKDLIPGKRALVAAFVQFKSSNFHSMPKNPADAGKAWASPRTWTFAAKALAAAEAAGASADVTHLMVAGCIGPAAIELAKWLEDGKLQDPEDLLREPQSLKLPKRGNTIAGDLVFAVLSAVASAVGRNKTAPRWKAAWEVFDVASRQGAQNDQIIGVASILYNDCRPDGLQAQDVPPIVRRIGVPMLRVTQAVRNAQAATTTNRPAK